MQEEKEGVSLGVRLRGFVGFVGCAVEWLGFQKECRNVSF